MAPQGVVKSWGARMASELLEREVPKVCSEERGQKTNMEGKVFRNLPFLVLGYAFFP